MSGVAEEREGRRRAIMRAGVLAAGILAAGVAAGWLARHGPGALPMGCIFHEVTGWHCPGCGMTRAAHALLEGRIADAFRFNPLGMILLPLALLALVPEAIGWVRGRAPRWRVPIGRRGGIVLLALVLGYMLLRNLPWMPFTLLAPPT